jgi:ribosomal protein S18 acetylase RimI-like enzyme
MWVAPEARGNGLGTALVQAAVKWSRQQSVRYLRLGVACGDSPAQRLYTRIGFVAHGEREPLRDGSSIEAQSMTLQLDGDAQSP